MAKFILNYDPSTDKPSCNITLQNIGRRFNREWIFKGIDYTFENKETMPYWGQTVRENLLLLQVLNGSLVPSAGTI
jgi:ABC-type polar amino acid transport system ATPase subunit